MSDKMLILRMWLGVSWNFNIGELPERLPGETSDSEERFLMCGCQAEMIQSESNLDGKE